jgi:hypothetical protein
MGRWGTAALAALCAAAAISVGIGAAGAAPAAADLQLDIGASTNVTQNPPVTPNGGSVTVTAVNFRVDVGVSLVTLTPARATVRLTLDDRLRWGANDAPDPSEGCTSTPTTALCETPELQSSGGQSAFGWNWPVSAPGAGSYSYRAEIAQASDTDPVSGNNASAITIVVTPATPPPQPTAVAAGRPKVSPAKPKAGSVVSASVRVTAGGAAVRPTRVACAGSIGTAKVAGSARAAAGLARCTYRTPRSAKGKTLRGAVSLTARGTRFTRRFSAKLG